MQSVNPAVCCRTQRNLLYTESLLLVLVSHPLSAVLANSDTERVVAEYAALNQPKRASAAVGRVAKTSCAWYRSRTTRNLAPSPVSMRIHVLLLSLMPGLQHRVTTALRPCRILRPAHRSLATATTAEVETETPLPFKMEDIVNLCKRRGFVFQSSEIYSPMPGFFDFGPLGVELKNNVTENIILLEFMLAILFRLRSYGGGTLCRSEMTWLAWTVRSLRLHSYGRPQDM